jgi:chemotaxis receptor (MCP) glutamine deamidase CheD
VKFNNSTECLGNRNVEAAVKFLCEQRIPIAEKKVGGSRGRKLIFQTTDGLAQVEQL